MCMCKSRSATRFWGTLIVGLPAFLQPPTTKPPMLVVCMCGHTKPCHPVLRVSLARPIRESKKKKNCRQPHRCSSSHHLSVSLTPK
ncbi:hypothetical protein F4778DRAFT_75844 [Xylariomycetidae sp. FL2044]|nr:hypothetical protein F4778DRAFT_75844 [Xylariomycetidae sp. FL2044]